MLSPAVQAVLKQDGFDLISPAKVTGSGVPSTVQSARRLVAGRNFHLQ